MKTRYRFIGLVVLAAAASLPLRAQLVVQSTVTPEPGWYHYSYDITNNTMTDFSGVTLEGLFPSADTIQNLSAPSGFTAFFDSGLGFLSLVEDSQDFAAGSTVGDFTFDSTYAPGAGTFEAVDITGGLANGAAVVPASAVPEPSTTAAVAAFALLALAFRRKFSSSKS